MRYLWQITAMIAAGHMKVNNDGHCKADAAASVITQHATFCLWNTRGRRIRCYYAYRLPSRVLNTTLARV